MKATGDGISVSILGKELMVACPPEEREALHQAAALLDSKMREVQEGGKVIGAERCALMAGLNISHELLQAHAGSDSKSVSEFERRVKSLNVKIERVLQRELREELN